MSLLVLFSLVAAASAVGEHKSCCTSHKLSGVMLTVSAFHKHGDKGLTLDDNVMEFYYDWDERETVVVSHAVNITLGRRVKSTIRLDYRYSTSYITTEDGNCYRQDLDPADQQSPCFFANFTYGGTHRVGTKTDGLHVNVFAGNLIGDNVKLAVTDDADCMPMTYMAYGEHGEVRRSLSYMYSNLKKAVNPDLFNIPRNCMNAPKIPSGKRALEELTGINVRVPF